MAEHDFQHSKPSSDGTVSYSDDVIATVAGLAAAEVPGVVGMSGGLVSGLTEAFGRKSYTKGVKVDVGNEQAALDLLIVVEHGKSIPQVARSVQENVRKAVETMTGLRVIEVNVCVQDINITESQNTARIR